MGEAEDASKYSKRCLQSGTDFCVDKKIVVEASDLLQKTQVWLFIVILTQETLIIGFSFSSLSSWTDKCL